MLTSRYPRRWPTAAAGANAPPGAVLTTSRCRTGCRTFPAGPD
ncbi:MAG TPA: hypothetical protein VF690_00590 [Hymenobacter sp.]